MAEVRRLTSAEAAEPEADGQVHGLADLVALMAKPVTVGSVTGRPAYAQ